MKKPELVKVVSIKGHLTKKASAEAVEVIFGEIQRTLQKGEKVTIAGFGTFRTTLVKDKLVRFPGTEEKKMVKSHREARFSPGRELKKIVK